MSRLVIVAYRPKPQHEELALAIMLRIYRAAKRLDIFSTKPLLGRTSEGELIYVAMIKSNDHVDRCWEDLAYQEAAAELSMVTEVVPMHRIHEASASFINLEGVMAPEKRVYLAANDALA